MSYETISVLWTSPSSIGPRVEMKTADGRWQHRRMCFYGSVMDFVAQIFMDKHMQLINEKIETKSIARLENSVLLDIVVY